MRSRLRQLAVQVTQHLEADMSKEIREERAKRRLDSELDRELEDTFPASDALKVTRRTPERVVTPEQAGDDEI